MARVTAKSEDRIQYTFYYEGKRYRPTLMRTPSEANLQRACTRLAEIKRRIASGTFDFQDDFPDYRLVRSRGPIATQPDVARSHVGGPAARATTCNRIFDSFLKHCEARVAIGDMAFSTLGQGVELGSRTRTRTVECAVCVGLWPQHPDQ
jgi:hypothetical protein